MKGLAGSAVVLLSLVALLLVSGRSEGRGAGAVSDTAPTAQGVKRAVHSPREFRANIGSSTVLSTWCLGLLRRLPGIFDVRVRGDIGEVRFLATSEGVAAAGRLTCLQDLAPLRSTEYDLRLRRPGR